MRVEGRTLFNVLLLAVFLVVFVVSFDYQPRARKFPQGVGLIGTLMVAGQLAVDVFPGRIRWLRFVERKGILADQEALDKAGSGEGSPLDWSGAFVHFFWLVVFVVLLRVTGYLIAVPVYIVFAVRFGGGQPWRRAIGLAIATTAALYVIFTYFLGASFG